MASSLSPSSGSPSVSRTLTHQVFLSFHGADVRNNLLTHILREFQRKGITPFIDNEIERGVSIGIELLRAIKHARITVVTFSRNYASSSWCLNELVEVMKYKDELNQEVMIIFHQVKPADVRTSEANMVATIAIDVLRKLQLTQPRDFDDYIGLQVHVTSIYSLLNLQTDEVRMIGIWGPSGIGKSTISRVLLNELSPQFQLSARLGDIKRRHLTLHDVYDAKVELQKELFCEQLKDKNIDILHLRVAKERFHDKKVLVVLDDVNELWQLQAAVHYPGWFGSGSRIIVTTEDRRDLAKEATEFASDLPLALQDTIAIRGINFNLSEIRHELEIDERAFERVLSLEYLKIYDEKFVAPKLHLPQDLKFLPYKLKLLHWDSFPMKVMPSKFQPEFLVKLVMVDSKLEKLWEGDQRFGSLKDINLLYSKNLKEIPNLSNATSLKRLNLGFCTSLVEIPSCIGNATNLEMINLAFCSSLVTLPSSIGKLDKLKKLAMVECSNLEAFPTNINLKSLSDLIVTSSKLKRFPEISTNISKIILSATEIEKVPSSVMYLSLLRKLDMNSCKSLKEFPPVPNSIEELDLSFTEIEEVPPSIQNLSCLTTVEMVGCNNLKVLPTNINLESLSRLDLSKCKGLQKFPNISKSIEYLNLSDTAIEEVPLSIWSWFRLLELIMNDCKSLKVFPHFPDSVQEFELSCKEQFPQLSQLHLNGCKNLVSLPQLPDSLSILNAANCDSLERILGSFEHPEIILNFANCFNLSQEARELIEILNCKFKLFPSKEVPAYFDHQETGDFLIITLDQIQRPFPLFFRFKACLLLLHGTYLVDDFDVNYSTGAKELSCRIFYIQNGHIIGSELLEYDIPALLGSEEHLYIFESSTSLNFLKTDVSFIELEFDFKITGKYWRIQRCGVYMEDTGVCDD
ncbi:PREDICTED: probable disease resistance protein RPP1 [Camelina sativa]|uniref:Probable disease resistance protein RPP1 n=1 Tax=Camelina sativa TaxID=90675 RepID=A0ABM0T0I2_CAMSA|nr:PREDICTED: probable disease resistance protein RPP1 [Camelina sativa]